MGNVGGQAKAIDQAPAGSEAEPKENQWANYRGLGYVTSGPLSGDQTDWIRSIAGRYSHSRRSSRSVTRHSRPAVGRPQRKPQAPRLPPPPGSATRNASPSTRTGNNI